MTLVNRTGGEVTGAWLRLDREIASVDVVGDAVFADARLRISPADTLRLEGGRLAAGKRVRYDLAGVGGPPRVVEGRWLVDGAFGPAITDDDLALR